MTLQEWCQLSDIRPTHPTTERGAVAVQPDWDSPHHQLLWRLSDFVVSSVCGSVVRLVPIHRQTAHPCSPEERAQRELRLARQELDRREQAVIAGKFDRQGLIALVTASAARKPAARRLHATAVYARNVASRPGYWEHVTVAPVGSGSLTCSVEP
jgi:hypothetical protein